VWDKFHDLLADFHCLDKNIFELTLFTEAQGQCKSYFIPCNSMKYVKTIYAVSILGMDMCAI
jgi:hypothetical protein